VPLDDEVGGDLVLYPRPDLVGVGEGDPGAPAVGPGAGEEADLVVEGVGPLGVVVLAEVREEVVPEHGADGLLHMILREQVAEARNVGVHLPQELVCEAAQAVLVLVGVDVVEPLDVELPVPEKDF